MDVPDIQINVNPEQAALLYRLIQHDILHSQRDMRTQPDKREVMRKRIILAQSLRRQIPECYWRDT